MKSQIKGLVKTNVIVFFLVVSVLALGCNLIKPTYPVTNNTFNGSSNNSSKNNSNNGASRGSNNNSNNTTPHSTQNNKTNQNNTSQTSGTSIILTELKSFPTAEGAGAVTIGGRTGKIVWVTNKNQDGDGSFRAALQIDGVKTILFQDGGTYPLTSQVSVGSGDVTIAGQSANHLGGVYFDTDGGSDNYISIYGGNIIVRYIGTRGWRRYYDGNGDPLLILHGDEVILDHVSDIGGVQGAGPYNGVASTIQHTLYTETTDSHNVGVQYWARDYDGEGGFIDYFNNAHILKSHRLPNVAARAKVKTRVINNYTYGWGSRHSVLQYNPTGDFINNLYQEAVGQSHDRGRTFASDPDSQGSPYASYYLRDNWHQENDGSVLFPIDNSAASVHNPNVDEDPPENRDTPLEEASLQPITNPEELKTYVLENAGAGVRFDSRGKVSTETEVERRYKDYAIHQNENDTGENTRVQFSTIPTKTRDLSDFEFAHGFSKEWAEKHKVCEDDSISSCHNEVKVNWGIQGYNIQNDAGYTHLEIWLAELAGDFHMLAKGKP